MMRRKMLLVLLGLGTIGGFASGFAGGHCRAARQRAFERHVAAVCIDAARGADRAAEAPPPAPAD